MRAGTRSSSSAAASSGVWRSPGPAVAAGKWVICDRFTDSTFAYQGDAGGLGRAAIERLAAIALDADSPVPDVTLDGADIASLLTILRAPSPHDELVLFINEDVAAVRTQRWKYVVRSFYRAYEGVLDAPGRNDWALLVDIEKDPAESYDVSSLHPDALADMAARVAKAPGQK